MSSSRLELVVDSRSAERHLSRLGGELERLDRRGTATTAMMGKMRLAVGAISAAAGGLGFSRIIRETASFEDAMLGLQAVSGATAKQMIDLEKQARSLGATSAFSAEQAGNAQRYLAMAGFEVNEVMSATPGILKLATAASIDLGRAADIASNILGGFRLEVDQLNRVNDVLAATAAGSNTSVEQLGEALSYAAPIAAAAGVSIEETAAAIGTLSDSGLQASRAGTGVLGFIRQLSNLTPNATAALESYGLAAAQVNIENEGLTVVLDRLRQANINTADSFKIFGSEAGPAAQILASGSDRVREFTGELGDAEGAAERAALIIGSGLTGSMRGFNSMVSESILQLGASGLAGGFGLVVDNATGVLAVYNDMLPEFAEANSLTETQVDRIRMLAGGLDLLKNAAILASGVIATRMVGSLGAATAAKIAATASAVRYQIAVTTLTGVSARAAAGQVALAGATRGAAGAMALLGGPLGLLVGAGGLMYMFREELGLVRRASEPTTQRIDNLTDAINRNSVAAVEAGIVNLAAEYFTLGQRAASATAEIEKLTAAQENDRQGAQARLQNNMRLRDLREDLAQIVTEQEAAGKGANELREILSGLGETVIATTDSTTDLNDTTGDTADAAKGASKEVTSLADAYESLLDRITPNRREARQYARDLGVLNLALATGRMTTVQYMQAMGLLQEHFQAAQRDTDDLATATERAAFTMEGAWDEVRLNGLRRLDNGFADLWESAIDGSLNAGELMKKALAQTLAEMAHMAITRPITVQLATNMGLNGGAAGGGFNGIGSLINGGKSLLGIGSSSTAAAAGGLYSGASTGLAAGGLYGNAVTGGVASTGIMSSITAGVSAAMPWIAGGLAIDSLLGGGITKAIGGLFGRKKTPFYGEFGTGDGVREYPQESAFGRIGFTRAQRLERGTDAGSQDWAGELATTSAALDNMLATLARSPAEFDAMTAAAENFRVGSGSVARLIQGQLVDRSLKILAAAGHDVTAAWGNLAADELASRIEMASGAMSVMEQASERLNIGFDATSATALLASTNIAEITGGIDQLASLNSSYYQAFFSDAERAANLQADLTQSLAAMNMQLPQTRDGYRRLVEAQDLHTAAGQRNYAQLLQLAPAFAELVPEMEDVATGVRDFAAELSTARDAITAAESDVRSAYKAFESQSFKQQLTLMEMAGDSAAALALQRERELLSIDPLLHETQRVIWSIEDETQAKQDAIGAAKNYATSLAQVSDQLASTFNGINAWVDQQNATGGTPGANLGEARAQLDRQLELARSGDRDALQSITQYADRALQANDAYNASGTAGQAIRDDVLAALKDLPDQISAEEYIAEEIKQALREQTEGISSQLGDVLRGDNPSNIAGNLAGFFTTLAGGIDGVLTREQLAIVMSGKATDAELQAIMRAVDLNGDGVMDGLESVIIQSLPTDAVLGTVLRNKMNELDKNQLTHAQIRTALSPIATDAEINRLIREVDVNGDGIITRQELANARISGLAVGIAKSLNPAFDMLDSNLDGKLTFAELASGLDGMATDEQLKAIARAVDLSGDGVISGLESVIIAGMPTDSILGNVLRSKMSELDKNQLTHAQIRNALSPLASDAEIKRLIHEVDVNGDGIISAQELSSARIGGLSRGIVGGLWPAFDMLDANLNGKLTYNELRKGLSGIATDAQIRALMRSMDLNGDGIMSQLESVVIKDMPTDVLLETALSNKLDELGTDQLTEAQIRKALSPIATDKEIDRLISLSSKTGSTQISWLKWQDGKLKAINSESRYTNNRLAGLARGIGSSLSPMFKSIDTSLDGLIDYKEFSKAFSGMATDKELRNIFGKLDEDGSGTIDRLEALARTGEGTEDNTKSLEERAYDQLASLNGLASEMARTTDQFVGLNSNVVSLRDAINALGVAQNEAARIEREQAVRGVEDEARVVTDRLSSTWDARSGTLSEIKSIENWGKGKDIDRLRPIAEQGTGEGVSGWHQNNDGKYRNWRGWESYFNELTGQLRGSDLEDMTDKQFSSWLSSEKKKHDPGSWGAEYIEVLARRIRAQELVAQADRDNAHKVNLYNQLPGHTGAIDVYQQQLADLRKKYADLAGSAAPFAKGGVFTNSIVSTPTYFDMGLMGEKDPEAIMPLSRAPGGRLGVDASGLMRIPDGPLELPMPDMPLPQFPQLGSNDVLQVLQDVKRELQESRKENKRLQEENNRHAAAAVAVQQEGFRQQISEQKKGNAALEDMSAAARLEASR